MTYKHIYVPVDNSEHSNRAVELGVRLARSFGAKVTASHVYAAKLHDMRFKQMEFTLPAEHRQDAKLERQRKNHDSLIGMGLKLVSDSYLDAVERKCGAAKVPFERKIMEGRNWEALSQDIATGGYDLVVMGALGTGAVGSSMLGSVCERVSRRVGQDILVVKDPRPLARQSGPIVAGIDGSPQSFAGLDIALALAEAVAAKPRVGAAKVRAVAVFDPYLHGAIFKGMVNVLSGKAARVFRFREQERLHKEVIDNGLAKVYQSHLDIASRMAREKGVAVETALKAGKPFDRILDLARRSGARLLVLGKVGLHSGERIDIGSNAENLLRLAPCNVLLTRRKLLPPPGLRAESSLAWTEEAKSRLGRVPGFARGVAQGMVQRHAFERGYSVVSGSVIDEVMSVFMPKAAAALQEVGEAAARNASGLAPAGRGGCPFHRKSTSTQSPARPSRQSGKKTR